MSYGGPESIDRVEAYFTHILQGRQPDPEHLKQIETQFRSLGTADPLRTVTVRQAEGLQQILEQSGVVNVKVYPAFKHASPFIEETVRTMISDGISHMITLPLIPFQSRRGIPMYQKAVEEEVNRVGGSITVSHLEGWHVHPQFVAVMAKRVKEAYDWIPAYKRNQTTVIFTAHSLPGNEEQHPQYVNQFKELAGQIMTELALPNWKIAYRSGRNEQWLGPDIKDAISKEKNNGAKGIVVCELLSLTNHIEVLYEIDRDCGQLAKKLEIDFARAESLNDSTDFMFALGAITKEKINEID